MSSKVRDIMEIRKYLSIIIGIFCLSFLIVLGPICTASNAELSITNVSVQLVETREPVGNRVIHVYDITAVLHNSGDMISDDVTVYFYDPEFNETTPPLKLDPFNVSLDPNESITFTLEDWPTPLTGDVPIKISFRPDSPDIVSTEFNSGSYTYTLQIEGNGTSTSTPGFEVALCIGAILVFLIWRTRKTK
jgi:hypothetical protein